MYDVIIVGARAAGSPTAMLLARKGYKVLLVDKATFPSDTMSTHQVQLPAVARLKRWGLLDKVIASNAPATRQVRFDLGPVVLQGKFPHFEGIDALYSPRRYILDKILVDAAVEAGAELRENFIVDEILRDADRLARDADAPAVERHHRHLEALVLLPEQRVFGDLAVVEGERHGGVSEMVAIEVQIGGDIAFEGIQVFAIQMARGCGTVKALFERLVPMDRAGVPERGTAGRSSSGCVRRRIYAGNTIGGHRQIGIGIEAPHCALGPRLIAKQQTRLAGFILHGGKLRNAGQAL